MCMQETVAGGGGNEVALCLLKVLNAGITDRKLLIVWCCNCTRQNKDCIMVFILIFMVAAALFEHTAVVSCEYAQICSL